MSGGKDRINVFPSRM